MFSYEPECKKSKVPRREAMAFNISVKREKYFCGYVIGLKCAPLLRSSKRESLNEEKMVSIM